MTDEIPTGDYTKDKMAADIDKRLTSLELGQQTRDSENTEVFRQLKDIKELLDSIASSLAALPCNPKCSGCPDEQTVRLKSIKPTG